MVLELRSLESARNALTRALEEVARSRKNLFRLAARAGLVSDPLPWLSLGDARALTSHTYDTDHTEAALEAARAFLPEGRALLEALAARHDRSESR